MSQEEAENGRVYGHLAVDLRALEAKRSKDRVKESLQELLDWPFSRPEPHRSVGLAEATERMDRLLSDAAVLAAEGLLTVSVNEGWIRVRLASSNGEALSDVGFIFGSVDGDDDEAD